MASPWGGTVHGCSCFAMVAVVWYQHEMIVSVLYLANAHVDLFHIGIFKSLLLSNYLIYLHQDGEPTAETQNKQITKSPWGSNHAVVWFAPSQKSCVDWFPTMLKWFGGIGAIYLDKMGRNLERNQTLSQSQGRYSYAVCLFLRLVSVDHISGSPISLPPIARNGVKLALRRGQYWVLGPRFGSEDMILKRLLDRTVREAKSTACKGRKGQSQNISRL